MRLLLVEDDPMIGESMVDALQGEHYAVDWVRDGDTAGTALAHQAYDLLLLDLGLPRKQGLAVLAAYRAGGGDAPVLIVTARDGTGARVEGLDAGADDYLVKPFALEELLARIRALLRRSAGRHQANIVHGSVRMDLATHEVTLDGQPVRLSVREFALLRALLEVPGRVMPKARLEEQLYAWGDEIESNAIDVHIHHLRKKLGAEFIVNVRGVGFKVAALT